MKTINRNVGLDLVRSIAIILVLISHGRHLLPDFNNKILFANGGFFGVELFFVLSGFLVGGILIKSIDISEVFDFKLILSFLTRRWFRTVPNYMLFLFLGVTIFSWLFGDEQFSVKYLIFLQNFNEPHPSLMPEAWSLSVEEWFYISFSLMLLAFPAKNKKWMLLAIVSYILLFTAFRVNEVLVHDPAMDSGVRKIVLFRLDAIGFGVLMAYLNYYYGNLLGSYKNHMLFVGIILISMAINMNSLMLLNNIETMFNKIFLFSISSIGFALMLPWFQNISIKTDRLSKFIRKISLISYSMYLVHLSFVIPFLHKYFVGGASWWVIYFMYWIITILISTLVYLYFEKPIMDLRDNFGRNAKVS